MQIPPSRARKAHLGCRYVVAFPDSPVLTPAASSATLGAVVQGSRGSGIPRQYRHPFRAGLCAPCLATPLSIACTVFSLAISADLHDILTNRGGSRATLAHGDFTSPPPATSSHQRLTPLESETCRDSSLATPVPDHGRSKWRPSWGPCTLAAARSSPSPQP